MFTSLCHALILSLSILAVATTAKQFMPDLPVGDNANLGNPEWIPFKLYKGRNCGVTMAHPSAFLSAPLKDTTFNKMIHWTDESLQRDQDGMSILFHEGFHLITYFQLTPKYKDLEVSDLFFGSQGTKGYNLGEKEFEKGTDQVPFFRLYPTRAVQWSNNTLNKDMVCLNIIQNDKDDPLFDLQNYMLIPPKCNEDIFPEGTDCMLNLY